MMIALQPLLRRYYEDTIQKVFGLSLGEWVIRYLFLMYDLKLFLIFSFSIQNNN